jgi:hypothetical protein
MTTTFDLIREAQPETNETVPVFPPIVACPEPECHRVSGSVSVGCDSFHYCSDHKVYWSTGRTPWKVSPEQLEKQYAQWDSLGLEGYTKVRPWVAGSTASA